MKRGRMLRDLERDIQDHIEMETRENVERGMAPEEARYAALRKFGNVARIRARRSCGACSGARTIGKRLRIMRPQRTPALAAIVGVAGDLKTSKLDADPEAEVYIPYKQSPFLRSMDVVVRAAGDPAAIAPDLRQRIAALDPSQPVYDVRTMEDALAESVAPRRFNLLLLAALTACWIPALRAALVDPIRALRYE